MTESYVLDESRRFNKSSTNDSLSVVIYLSALARPVHAG